MKDYQRSYQTVAGSAATTGQKPSVWVYLVIRLADNIAIVLLFALTLTFAAVGLCAPSTNTEAIKWSLDAAKLCLGVFLGVFAGKRRG